MKQLYKRLLLALAVAIIAIVTPLGVSEFRYQQKINAMKDVVAVIGKDVVVPAGGKAKGELYVKAPHLIDSFCIDNGPCPSVNGQWFVPVAKGAEKDFMATVLAQQGYQDIVAQDPKGGMPSEGTKDGYKVTLYLSDPYANEAPRQAPSDGKEWKILSVTLY
jgi:hypothetical protein